MIDTLLLERKETDKMDKKNMFSLEGKIALVTGGAHGIGFAIAESYAEAGATVVFNCSNEESLKRGLAAYKEKGIDAHGYVCDVTDEEAVKKMIADIEEKIGTVDILVNNAGMIRRIPMHEMSAEEFRKVVDVDLNAPFYPKFSHEILNQCLTDFELPQNLHLGALSMGQKKKAFMSFALATNCRLLLMDEPTNGLDIPSKSLFRKVVTRHLTDDRTLIISTHQVADVAMLIDHVLMLSESQLLLNRPVSEISRVLRFEERPIGADISDALYVQPSIQGNALITLNHCPDNETPVNLELLFNCAQCGKLPAELL